MQAHDTILNAGGGLLFIAFWVFILIWAILLFLLPFIVNSIRRTVREILEEQRKATIALTALRFPAPRESQPRDPPPVKMPRP